MPRNQTKLETPVSEVTTEFKLETPVVPEIPQTEADTAKRKSTISKFADPTYNAPISNICICQVINHMEAEKVGLFIKDKYLAGINWQGQEPNHKHTFSSGKPEMGVLLQSPRMHILDISPRYVEQRDDGKIIGMYESPDGYDMYQALGKDKVVLRRFYLLQLVDDKNNNLHSVPIVLSIKGVASSQFGEAYKQFQRELEVAFARFENTTVAEKRREFHRLGVFQPTFTPSHEPKDAVNPKDRSWVAVVTSYKSPNPDGSDFLEFFSEDKENDFYTTMQANPEFSHRIGKTSAVVAEHHRLASTADTPVAALPPSSNVYEVKPQMDEIPY
jgi:hypothetical protein